MSLTVAELFVVLGVKGANTLGKTLSGVQSGLAKTAEMSWQAKAGILAAVVGLEEITRFAANSATELHNFAGATGLGTDVIQRLGYAAQMNRIPMQELMGTIEGLQTAQAKMSMGEGVTPGAFYFGLDQGMNPLQLYEQVQKKIRSIGNDQREIAKARYMFSTMGGSSNMFAMFRTGAISMKGFTKDMALTNEEVAKLLKLDRKWSDFWMVLKGTTQKNIANNFAGPITEAIGSLSDAFTELNVIMGRVGKLMTDFPKTTTGVEVGLTGILALFYPVSAALIAFAAILKDLHDYENEKPNGLNPPKSYIGALMTDWTGGAGGRPDPNKLNFFGSMNPWGTKVSGPKSPGASVSDIVNDKMEGFVKNTLLRGTLGAPVGISGKPHYQYYNIQIDGAQSPAAVVDEIQRRTNDGVTRNPAFGTEEDK